MKKRKYVKCSNCGLSVHIKFKRYHKCDEYVKCSNCGLSVHIKFKPYHKCGFQNCPKCLSAVSPDSYDDHIRSHLVSLLKEISESRQALKERNDFLINNGSHGSKLTHSRCDVCSMIVPSLDLKSHYSTHFNKCPTCNEMIFESDFKNHFDSHKNPTQKTETKKYTLTKKRFINDRSEYRHDRAAEVF